MSLTDDIAAEQRYLDDLLERVDQAREKLEQRLKAVRLEADIDDPQGLMVRDREARDIAQRLDSYSAAEIGLMFGRIDVEDAEAENPVPGNEHLDRRYIGRIGLHDDDEQMRTLLMDWRAPLARPFYLATTLRPDGVNTRRHITTRGRTVRSVADEQLSTTAGPTDAVGTGPRGGVAKEEALLDAVNRARTAYMQDIVETIAAEQDAIIRAAHRGVTVVQGAPGTGKTAVALHRAAYLLYTWREQLDNTGVLIIGPNDRFLSYISQVLPSLGETGVVLATPGTLLPNLHTVPETNLLAREVKGSAEMLTILADAIKTYQTVPEDSIDISIDGLNVQLTPKMVRAARTRARRSRKPHNHARAAFLDHGLNSLAEALGESIGADPLGGENLLGKGDIATLREELGADPTVVDALGQFWPELEPNQVLERLYADPAAIAVDYDEDTWRGLAAHPSGEWTDADAPLIDELIDMLGYVSDEETAAEEREQWLEKITEAQEALDILTGSASQDLDDGFAPEVLMAYDVIDAETLAARQRVRDHRTTAERAAADSRWAFGHVIVDEAQELSEMAWRMVFRRSPNKWMTLVGDPAQTGNPGGVDSWAEALSPFVADRWQLHQLTVNYRTPKDIADLAAPLLHEIDPSQPSPLALRESGTGVRYAKAATGADLGSKVQAAVEQARELTGESGLIGVITANPARLQDIVTEQAAVQSEADKAGVEVVLVDTAAAKGLEFDEVILVEPADIVESSPQGLNDLYVAMTRATQGLTVVQARPLPWD
ncbi:ATP-binding domain-containing protein [uncultured Corynebacterium sp.]|uniref:HelD family protein n=1 Tax=uncultured Corynebacterium sp. TaxID=159447 RepID=UPI002604AC56|nr:ATP-binding domain-containing protein [uncultured Corynebacterium sp.]